MGDELAETLGDWISTWRKRHGMSQRAFADLVGVREQRVSAWVRGQQVPSNEDREKLVPVLKISRKKLDQICDADPYEVMKAQVEAVEAAAVQMRGSISRLRQQRAG